MPRGRPKKIVEDNVTAEAINEPAIIEPLKDSATPADVYDKVQEIIALLNKG